MSEQKTMPAFPRPAFSSNGIFTRDQTGMTLRDYFAAKAMASYITHNELLDVKKYKEVIAKASYEMADAMLAERDKQTAVQGDKNGHS